ncbi:MAG TPA: hypothetical protein VMV05_06640 [bacterium]|nr:hypothetical protein [bacterium]
MQFPVAVAKILELAGKAPGRPLDRLEKGKPLTAGQLAVAKSGLNLLAQGALYLYFDCFEEAHNIANDHEGSLEGNWIHAILHRREPDAWNSKYWYARVRLPKKASQALAQEALQRLGKAPPKELEDFQKKLTKSGEWEPEAFVDICDKVRKEAPNSEPYKLLAAIQEAEWKGLLETVLG